MSTNATIAVTLRPVRVSGFAPLAGVVAVTLKHVSVAASAHSANGAAGAVTLKHPTVAGAGHKATVGSSVVTLKKVTPALSATIGATNTITSINPVLKHVTVSASALHLVGSGGVTLKHVTVAGTATKGITGSGTGGVILKRITPNGYAVNKYINLTYSVMCVTGLIYGDGSAVFQFRGRAGLGVSWAILTGSGSIAPLGPSYTDDSGLAFAKYDAGGYTGPLKIGATYVA